MSGDTGSEILNVVFNTWDWVLLFLYLRNHAILLFMNYDFLLYILCCKM